MFSFNSTSARTLVRPLALGLAAAIIGSSASAVQIHQYNQARHDRFEAGSFPTAPVANGSLWANHDFSGVGWSANDPRKGFAMISPRHFVGANHFRPALNSQIVFLNRDGDLKSYSYTRFYTLKNDLNQTADLFIGELSADIPASDRVTFYPVLNLPEAELVGREILVYGRGFDEPRIGKGTIARFGDSFGTGLSGPLDDTRNYQFDYASNSAGSDNAYGEIGDSGSPSFILDEGELSVSGTHSAIDDRSTLFRKRITTYDSFVLHFQAQIDAHIGPTGHQLTLLPRPLPVATGFEIWQNEHFNATELANEEISGPLASPAGDGVANLMKYALGAPPMTPDRSMLPVIEARVLEALGNEAYLTLAFRRPDETTDLEYLVDFSPSLTDWTEPAVLAGVEVGNDGTTGYTYRAPESLANQPHGFMHLRVNRIEAP